MELVQFVEKKKDENHIFQSTKETMHGTLTRGAFVLSFIFLFFNEYFLFISLAFFHFRSFFFNHNFITTKLVLLKF